MIHLQHSFIPLHDHKNIHLKIIRNKYNVLLHISIIEQQRNKEKYPETIIITQMDHFQFLFDPFEVGVIKEHLGNNQASDTITSMATSAYDIWL